MPSKMWPLRSRLKPPPNPKRKPLSKPTTRRRPRRRGARPQRPPSSPKPPAVSPSFYHQNNPRPFYVLILTPLRPDSDQIRVQGRDPRRQDDHLRLGGGLRPQLDGHHHQGAATLARSQSGEKVLHGLPFHS